MDDAHTKSVDEVVNYFKTDGTFGLSDDQVKRAQEKYGPNGKSRFPSMWLLARIVCENAQV